MNNNDSLIDKRNFLIKEFFSLANLSVRLIGDTSTPSIIYNEKWCLSCRINNFNLIFMNKPENGIEIKRFKLENNMSIDNRVIIDTIGEAIHKKIFKIKLINNDLYLSGYNYIDKSNQNTKYPVFSKYNGKIYFEKKHAENIITEYSFDYNLEIV